ncbi:MAG: type II toxin-antitoxin system PemK/MazF family toxin [Lactobacillales bacterium]|nr:type II toxin-antitoxin system PemK/MazF family toxin [Lactobacillales bacterium]
MKRGEIWTLRNSNYASKARPVVIIQSDKYLFDSVILSLFTSYKSENIVTRLKIKPTDKNGLNKTSYVMTDKIISFNKKLLNEKIGELLSEEMKLLSEKLKQILDI